MKTEVYSLPVIFGTWLIENHYQREEEEEELRQGQLSRQRHDDSDLAVNHQRYLEVN